MSFNEIERFGFNWQTKFNANKKYKQGINIYIVVHYMDLNKNLKTTKMYILEKKYLQISDLKNCFKDAVNEVLMKYVFPGTILDTFYYTDERTVIPKEFKKSNTSFDRFSTLRI
ncbi:MAG: hypothetical protein ACQERD_00930 [Campylobacterota bacterium]